MLAGMFDVVGPLALADIADVVAFAVSRRRELNLPHIIALPTRQA
jgi:NADP-dependent 3-hydroxy acid dehydrogenase YdfG